MLKFIAAAIWICVITVSAVFYSFQAAGERGADQPPKPLLGGLDYVKTDIISVPLVRDAAVQGYFLTNLVYTVDPAQVKKLSVPAPALITDQINFLSKDEIRNNTIRRRRGDTTGSVAKPKAE